MNPWRDKRSLPALFLGLVFLFLAVKPMPGLQELFSPWGSFVLPLAKALQPFRSMSGATLQAPRQASEPIPDANWLAQKEAAFTRPRDPDLSARALLFASRSSQASEPDTFRLDAGAQHGVQEGMLVTSGDFLLGEVTKIEAQRCLVRMACHPLSQIGAKAGDVRLIAAGGRQGTMKIELPSGRGLEAGLEVRGDPVPAILGKLENGTNGRKGSFLVRPPFSASQISGAWILRADAGGGQKAMVSLEPAAGQWAEAMGLWPEISPHGRGGLYRVEGNAKISSGAAAVAEGRFYGLVERVSADMLWIRSLGDPAMRLDALLVEDGGALRSLPRLTFAVEGGRGWRLASLPPGMKEGWLFTGAGRPGIPKGLLLGKIRKDERGFFLERAFPGFPSKVRVAQEENAP